jgi:hypothetical protein
VTSLSRALLDKLRLANARSPPVKHISRSWDEDSETNQAGRKRQGRKWDHLLRDNVKLSERVTPPCWRITVITLSRLVGTELGLG